MADRIVKIEVDGYTTCIHDTEGVLHCFRIDPEIGTELRNVIAAAQEVIREFNALKVRLAQSESEPDPYQSMMKGKI